LKARASTRGLYAHAHSAAKKGVRKENGVKAEKEVKAEKRVKAEPFVETSSAYLR
jgi:hypothetical protein